MAKYKIVGIVYDENKKPIPSASVYISNQSGEWIGKAGTNFSADEKGRFTLDTEDGQYITASAKGYATQTKAVTGNIVWVPLPSLTKTPMNMPTMAFTLSPKGATSSQTNIDKTAGTQGGVFEDNAPTSRDSGKMSKGLKIGLIVGGSVVALVIIALIIKKSLDKKTIPNG